MIDILAAVLFDNVPYRLRKCSWFITADADMIAVLASDIDYRLAPPAPMRSPLFGHGVAPLGLEDLLHVQGQEGHQ